MNWPSRHDHSCWLGGKASNQTNQTNDQVSLKPSCSATETSKDTEILGGASLTTILSSKWIIEALITLKGQRFAGWGAPLFLICSNIRFSLCWFPQSSHIVRKSILFWKLNKDANQTVHLRCLISISVICSLETIIGPRSNKTCLQGFQQSETQTSLLSYRDHVENWNFTCSNFLHMILYQMRITKALSDCADAMLVCACVVRKPPKTWFLASGSNYVHTTLKLLYRAWSAKEPFWLKNPCENEVGFIGTVLELSGTHFNGTFWDNHLIPINPNVGIIWY